MKPTLEKLYVQIFRRFEKKSFKSPYFLTLGTSHCVKINFPQMSKFCKNLVTLNVQYPVF
jgi:hypothetical protein